MKYRQAGRPSQARKDSGYGGSPGGQGPKTPDLDASAGLDGEPAPAAGARELAPKAQRRSARGKPAWGYPSGVARRNLFRRDDGNDDERELPIWLR